MLAGVEMCGGKAVVGAANILSSSGGPSAMSLAMICFFVRSCLCDNIVSGSRLCIIICHDIGRIDQGCRGAECVRSWCRWREIL